MSSSQSVRYTTNLIRKMRLEEQKAEQRQRLSTILAIGSFCFLFLALLYGAISIHSMENVLRVERQNLQRLQGEFQKYTSTLETVDKADVEELNGLQIAGIFWSKKLAVLGQYLPDGYWLRSIRYDVAGLKVSGYTQLSPAQDELLALQDYLKRLEQDSTFKLHFATVRLTSARRNTENANGMTFEFYAEGKK